ncbi:MAG: hypothetical protein Q7S65_00870 [Nanoarchaeota archaeon]|nr:hypothetical protein [Nanoarchaeota archaeon]
MIAKEVCECFANALKDEKNGKKHKGLLVTAPDNKGAQEYVLKAKTNLKLCHLFKEQNFDYKIPEEWFYTLYYCALAILAKFGVESRSQRCTAVFIRYVKDKKLIEYSDEFIDRIRVYREKEGKSDVDERETARYSSSLKSEAVETEFGRMDALCKRAIDECERIVFSTSKFKVPIELLE